MLVWVSIDHLRYLGTKLSFKRRLRVKKLTKFDSAKSAELSL